MSLRDAIMVSVPGKAKLSTPFDFQGFRDRPLVCRWCFRRGVDVALVMLESKKKQKSKRIVVVVMAR
jgi:hypothetical protein